jgi:hypothetical protein
VAATRRALSGESAGRLRFSLDKHLGQHVESREDALKAFGDVRTQVLAGTFVLGNPGGAQPAATAVQRNLPRHPWRH